MENKQRALGLGSTATSEAEGTAAATTNWVLGRCKSVRSFSSVSEKERRDVDICGYDSGIIGISRRDRRARPDRLDNNDTRRVERGIERLPGTGRWLPGGLGDTRSLHQGDGI